jgi:N-acetylmuramoyl-L-alanine amidase
MKQKSYKIIVDSGERDIPQVLTPICSEVGSLVISHEDEIAYDIAWRTEQKLTQKGCLSFLSRNRGKLSTIQNRCDFANKMKADLFVSIYINNTNDQTTSGLQVYSCQGSRPGAMLRNAIYGEVRRLFPDWADQGTKEAGFYVLRGTDMPAVTVECGRLSNPEEKKLLTLPEIRERFAEGIAAGVESYLVAIQD